VKFGGFFGFCNGGLGFLVVNFFLDGFVLGGFVPWNPSKNRNCSMKIPSVWYVASKRLLWFLMVMLVVGCAVTVRGQTIHCSKGTQFPAAPSGSTYDWFLNTDSLKAYFYKAGRWVEASYEEDSIVDISTCNGVVILHKCLNAKVAYFQIFHPLGYNNGAVLDYVCGENILVQRNLNGYISINYNVFDGRSRSRLAMNYNCDLSADNRVVPDTVLGKIAFCAAKYVGEEWKYWDCSAIGNWGMLDGYGKWVIDPKFDDFFYFDDGIAEVVYRGKWRKINEQGKFVQ
jgi:hypothetical protein